MCLHRTTPRGIAGRRTGRLRCASVDPALLSAALVAERSAEAVLVERSLDGFGGRHKMSACVAMRCPPAPRPELLYMDLRPPGTTRRGIVLADTALAAPYAPTSAIVITVTGGGNMERRYRVALECTSPVTGRPWQRQLSTPALPAADHCYAAKWYDSG